MKLKSVPKRVSILLVTVGIVVSAGQASAAKRIWAMLSDQASGTPANTTYTTTTGESVWAEAVGYDATATNVCGARSYYNQSMLTVPCTGSSQNAVKYQSFIRSTSYTFCTNPGGKTPWGQLTVTCNTPPLLLNVNGVRKSNVVLGALGRGIF